MTNESPSAAYVAGRYAAIDIGTVTCRLLIADVSAAGEIAEVYRQTVICNLGLGVDETKLLAPESIERVGRAVEGFVEALVRYRLDGQPEIPVQVVATSASRDAENADEFKQRLSRAGLELNIIPGEREAALSFAGASAAFAGDRVIVLDIGGGSTEIIAGLAGGDPDRARSFNVGCRRVTERYFHDDPPTHESVAQAGEWVSSEFADYLGELQDAGLLEGRVVAVAGTATSVVSMREEMVEYDSSRVHGAIVSDMDVNMLLDRLSMMTNDQRKQVVGLDPGRAPVIVAGLVILAQIMQLANSNMITVSESDILHGIILSCSQRA